MWEDAEQHFEKALRLAEDLPHRLEQAEVRRWYARMLLDRNASGDRKKARELLGEALASYRARDAQHVEMVEALL